MRCILPLIVVFSFHLIANEVPRYMVLEAKTIVGVKAGAKVQIYERLDEDKLKLIALSIKSYSGNQPRSIVHFYLPYMDSESFAWAIAKFTPALEIEIFGATYEEWAQLANIKPKPNEVGRWFRDLYRLSSVIIFFRKDDQLMCAKIFNTGETWTESLYFDKERYWYENDHSEYMKIESNGRLGLYGLNGKFAEMEVIKRPDPSNERDQDREILIAQLGDEELEPPQFTYKATPVYPQKAIDIMLQGRVVLGAVFRKDGSIDEIEVIRGLGRGKYGFEEAAIDALKRWTFKPGRINGKKVDVRGSFEVEFKLN